MLQIRTIVCGAYAENAYLVSRPNRPDAFLIDPGDALGAIQRALESFGKSLGAILLTHGHFDHMLATGPILDRWPCTVYVHRLDRPMLNDSRLNLYDPAASVLPAPEGLCATEYEETLHMCGVDFSVLQTPGHTPGSVCLYAESQGVLFSGDTLFEAGYGRVDFPGSSPKDMRASLRMLFQLPGDTKVYSGHGSATTIGRERARYGL